jgi:hypothetical protein
LSRQANRECRDCSRRIERRVFRDVWRRSAEGAEAPPETAKMDVATHVERDAGGLVCRGA